MATRETVAALLDAGKMVSCRWPGSGDLTICLERRMIDAAMSHWANGTNANVMASVRAAIKRVTKRIKQGRATPREMDELASDIAIFLGHELVHGDGETWLIKAPTGADIRSSGN